MGAYVTHSDLQACTLQRRHFLLFVSGHWGQTATLKCTLNIYIFILNYIYFFVVQQLLLVCPLLYFHLFVVVCLSSYIRRRQFLSKALVYYCFLVFSRTGEYFSLEILFIISLKSRSRPRALYGLCYTGMWTTSEAGEDGANRKKRANPDPQTGNRSFPYCRPV